MNAMALVYNIVPSRVVQYCYLLLLYPSHPPPMLSYSKAGADESWTLMGCVCVSRNGHGCCRGRMKKVREEIGMGLGHIGRGDPIHIEVRVLMEFDLSRRLSHRATDVLVRHDGDHLQLLCFAPLEESKVFDIHMAVALCRGLRLDHEDGARIIHIEVVGAVKVKTQGTVNRYHRSQLLTSVCRADKFCLSARSRNRTLVFRFINHCGAGHDNDHAADGSTTGKIRTPVRIGDAKAGECEVETGGEQEHCVETNMERGATLGKSRRGLRRQKMSPSSLVLFRKANTALTAW